MNFPRWSLVLLLLASPVVAQSIPIHGSDQKASYASPAEWPFLSAQAHWGPANDMAFTGDTSLLNPTVGHVHVECNAPIYGDVKQPITLPCDVLLFHLGGEITTASNNAFGVIDWGALNGVRLFGNPMGIAKFPFTLTLNPNAWRESRPHGWVSVQTTMRVALTNGAVVDASLAIPFYSSFDLSVPEAETNCDGCGALLHAVIEPHAGESGHWGEIIIETKDILPILGPLTAPFVSGTMRGQTYAQSGLAPPGFTDARADLDLHNGITGHPVTFSHYDPSELGPGTHKVAMMWREDSGEGNAEFLPHEAAAALLVVTVTVPDGTVPLPPTPVDCVQSAWLTTSTDVTSSPWVVVGDHEERTVTTVQHQMRSIVTPPAHGGTACGPSTQDITTVTTESRFPPPPPSSLSGCQAVVSNPTTTAAINTLINGLPGGGLVCVPTGTYVLDVTQAPIRLGSHITLLLWPGAILQAAPNALEEFSVVTIHGTDDSRIMGQGEIRGDRLNHLGTTGEWGHGVVLEGSSNTVIDGVTIDEHWGDGIYITDDGNPAHPTTFASIHHVLVRHNRRNNLSAIDWDGGQISDSTFREAGGTAPGAGMDFEPNVATQAVSAIIVTGNWFYANQGNGFETIPIHGPVKNSIVTSNISAGNGGAGFLFTGALNWTAANNLLSGNGQ